MSERICKHEGCGKPSTRRGFCHNHYRQRRTAGDPEVSQPRPPKEPCSVEGCAEMRIGKQPYCNLHYQRVHRHGSTDAKVGGPGRVPCLKCPRCNKAFKASAVQRRRASEGAEVYCSRDCQKGSNLVTIPCASHDCPKVVTRRKSDVPPSGRVFCDVDCRGRAQKDPNGENIPCECGCGQTVYVIPALRGIRRFASVGCKNRWQMRHRFMRACANCGEEFEVRPSDPDLYCSRQCHGESRRAKPGDRYVNPETGYAWVWIDDGQGGARKVQEHRYVMERHIGRSLYSWETVHHQTGGFEGRSNNDLGNLELWASRHPRGHRVEGIVAYCRQMLALYGDDAERVRYAGHLDALAGEAPA